MDENQLTQPSKIAAFKQFIIACKRVLTVTKKPTTDEFKIIIKVSGLGILLIGAIGFIIHLFKQLFFS
ncbi:MAG: protein translocase SEC61 complex subunit gamma [Nanoarchaeota archaeon]